MTYSRAYTVSCRIEAATGPWLGVASTAHDILLILVHRYSGPLTIDHRPGPYTET